MGWQADADGGEVTHGGGLYAAGATQGGAVGAGPGFGFCNSHNKCKKIVLTSDIEPMARLKVLTVVTFQLWNHVTQKKKRI